MKAQVLVGVEWAEVEMCHSVVERDSVCNRLHHCSLLLCHRAARPAMGKGHKC